MKRILILLTCLFAFAAATQSIVSFAKGKEGVSAPKGSADGPGP